MKPKGLRLFAAARRFAEIVWAHAPVRTRELVALCADALDWRRTTYTVLRRLRAIAAYKKPAVWRTVFAAAAAALLTGCFLTNPKNSDPKRQRTFSPQSNPGRTYGVCPGFDYGIFFASSELR